MNLVSVFSHRGFFSPQSDQLEVKMFGIGPIQISLYELFFVGGFVILTIVGVILERLMLIFMSKDAEPGWVYRNRIKIYYALIAILLVIWTTIQGYIFSPDKKFDYIWVYGSVVVILYCILLIIFPRRRCKKN